MRLLDILRLRLRSIFVRRKVEQELEEELRYHLERQIEEEVQSGASAEEAHYAALRSIRDIEQRKEQCRDTRGIRWLEDALTDVRFAVRTLGNAPVFSATVIAALAICIGANAAIFSIVDTILFRPLPFADQERLVAVTEGVPGLGFPVMPFSCPDYLFIAENNRSFAGTAAYRTQSYEISGVGKPQRITGGRLTASLFQALGVAPASGRAFTHEEDEQAKRVAVLSYGLAQGAFGTTERALGRTFLLDRIPYTVIGVMPRSFSFPIQGSRFSGGPADVFIPVSWTQEDRQQNVSNFDYSVIARLKPNVSLEQANSEMRGLLKRIVESYPSNIKQALSRMPNFSLESQTVPFREEYTGNVQRPLLLLLAAVGVVLLIGCADVANLMFSRMAGRGREFALRTALGAGRWRLTRQTVTEGLILSIVSGAVGLWLAAWALPLLIHLAPANLPRATEIGLNWRMMAFVLAVALATPLVFCLAPLATTFRSGVLNSLRGEGRTTTQGKHQRLIMSAAVVAQFSLSFLLMTAAGLLARSLMRAAATNTGFQPEHLISATIALPKADYKTPAQVTGFFTRLLSHLDGLPGVRRTGAISDLPMGSTSNVIISVEGRSQTTERVDMVFTLGNALDALGVSLLRGRLLGPEDQIGKPHSAVISDALAKRIWPQGDPIGRRIRFGVDVPNNDEPWLTVVGVVADVKARLTSNAPRMLLFTSSPDWVNQMDVVLRSAGDPGLLASVIRREISRLDPNLPAERIQRVDQVLQQSLAAERFRTWLLLGFATTALFLAMLGIGGLLAYNTAQRTREFGVRIALGADRRALLLLVLRYSLRLSGTGIVIGLLASVFAARALANLLYDTSPHDFGVFLAVPSILALVALGASLLPAWRVLHTDPILALHTE